MINYKEINIETSLDFLMILDKEDIPYVSWKNNHELDFSLEGNVDLDILVPIEYKRDFMILLRNNFWVEVYNPVAKYPFISHYYKYTQIGFQHLHVYFKLVTGESWIKEFCIPIEKFLIDNRVKHLEKNIWVLNDNAQLFIFQLRKNLKSASFLSRLLYNKEIKSYSHEFYNIKNKKSEALTAFTYPIPIVFESCLNSRPTNLILSIWQRILLFPYIRFNPISLSFVRIHSLIYRVINKLFIKEKKKFLGYGMIVAITGTDGSGKTTLTALVNNEFKTFMSLRQIHLGKPQGSYVDICLNLTKKLLNNIFNNKKDFGVANEIKEKDLNSISSWKAISSLFIAFLRLRNARKANKLASKGYFVIADRWPTKKLGVMDGPKINLSRFKRTDFLIRACCGIERWIYNNIPPADFCINLTVPVDVAIQRNNSRTKLDKETTNEIIKRHKESYNYSPISRKVITIENNMSIQESLKTLLAEIWRETSRIH